MGADRHGGKQDRQSEIKVKSLRQNVDEKNQVNFFLSKKKKMLARNEPKLRLSILKSPCHDLGACGPRKTAIQASA